MAAFGTVARPYAKAIFEIATAEKTLAAWSNGSYLARPAMRAAERANFLQSILEGAPDAQVFESAAGKNLLRLLSENNRLGALPEIAAQFDKLKAQAENKVKVTLVAATQVDGEQAAKVTAALQRKLGREVELTLEVDPKLLGGAVVRAEDMVIDGSVRSRLQRLAGSLID
jgi:F-type H+-transporting ATPase subunit delta